MDAEWEQNLRQVMDQEFVATLQRWQEAIAGPVQGQAGSPLGQLCQVLRDWLGRSIVTYTFGPEVRVHLVPDALCARITEVARAGGMGRPQTMLALLALIERVLHAMETAEGSQAARAWEQAVAESALYAQAWLADFKPLKRSVTFGPGVPGSDAPV